jgi:6-phosphogluconolactonase (cycloisomerase 2 family)
LSSGNFYVLNQATSQIVAYNINSGSLNQIGVSTMSSAPIAIAVAPSGNFLYVSTLVGIYLYSIGSNGALTIGNNSGVISQDPAASMQVDTTNGWLVDAVQGTSGVQLDAIPITSSGTYSGTVRTASFTVTNAAVHQLVISPDDDNVFVALGAGGTIVIPFNANNPFPSGVRGTTIAVANTAGSALSVAVDPNATPRLFYIGETVADSTGTTGGLRVFNYSSLGSSTLTQASGSPIASGGLAPASILPLTTGDYVYVANGASSSSGNVAGFAITSTGSASSPTYTVATVGTISAGTQPVGLAEDSQDNFVIAVSSGGNPDLEAYTMSAGALTAAITSTTGTDPVQAVAVAAAP